MLGLRNVSRADEEKTQAFDVNAGCAGFVTAFAAAEQMLASLRFNLVALSAISVLVGGVLVNCGGSLTGFTTTVTLPVPHAPSTSQTR